METHRREQDFQNKIDKLKDPKPYREKGYYTEALQELSQAIHIIAALRDETYENHEAWGKLYNAGLHLQHVFQEHLDSLYGDIEEEEFDSQE